jgi:glyoxylase-like metal-dependent hydrolase (beta-lactamase superfamily II)
MASKPQELSTARRRSCITTLLVLVGMSPATTPAFAQKLSPFATINAEAASSNISVQHLRGNISVLEGSGGNIGVLAGRDGLLMVDDGIAVSQQKIATALHSIDAGPLRYVINTHWHWDHTDGNGWVRNAGATIIGHENTVRWLSRTVRVVEWDHTFAPVPAADRPSLIVTTGITLKFDGETIRIRHYNPGHTNGDLSVYFSSADVLQVGDTWWNGYYPFIDYVTGGSIDGMIRAANANIASATDQTVIIPGHGPVGGRAELTEYRDMLVTIRAKVAELKSQGKSLDEVLAAKPTAAYDAKWGNSVIDPALFTSLVYRGV